MSLTREWTRIIPLEGKSHSGQNFVTGEDPNNYTDTVGHGTMVAGIIAALANNSIGIAGVAPLVKIMPLKVLDPTGTFFNVDLAIEYALDNGASVINMSFGSNTTLDQATQSKGCSRLMVPDL